ncbi:hypothetical protein GOBAR_DD04558 [Gossypium barbadense]|nr:hypothetical protein GOBAR_DD04558 [Gossypium barbadense]
MYSSFSLLQQRLAIPFQPKSAAPPQPLPPNINISFLRTKSPPSPIAWCCVSLL